MTERLYYMDATLLQFDAVAVAHGEAPTHLMLDRSAFYPTSGGQPHDTGTINGVAVLDVIDAGDQIIHVMAEPVSSGPVRGIVDASRRHDHMQQHTAQHLLSAVAADQLGWETTSVHFGADHSTIEFATANAGEAALRQLEAAANAVVARGCGVTVSFESSDEAALRGLRKPSDRSGVLRVVTIDGVDRSACGGTHLAQASEIGMVQVTGTEKVRGHVRVGFLAGNRVLAHARAQAGVLASLAADLGCSMDEVPAIVAARKAEIAAAKKQLQTLEPELAAARVRALAALAAPDADGIVQLHYQASDDSPTMLRAMAQQVGAMEHATLTIVDHDSRTVHFATSADSGIDAGSRLKAALVAAGGRGGGNARVAQGSVPPDAGLDTVLDAMRL